MGAAGMTRRRARGERGVTLLEMVATTGLLLVVTTPLLANMGSSLSRQQQTADAAEVASEGRLALARVVRDVREAASLTVGASPEQVVVWVDDDMDRTIDVGEEITYTIASGALTRTDGITTQTLTENLITGSTLRVVTVSAGPSVEVNLVLDARSSGAAPVTLHTQAFPRV